MARHRLNKAKNGDWYVLIGPYDPALVDELRRRIPSNGKEWRPATKLWRIAPEWVEETRAILAELES